MAVEDQHRRETPPQETSPPTSEDEKTQIKDDIQEGTVSRPVYLTGIKLWTVIGCITLVFFLVLLDIAIIATAVPQITSDFHSLEDVGWYGSAYQLASAAFQPLTGKIYARFNSKWVFLSFFAIFELGSLICGVSQSSGMFIGGRTIAGLGCSGLQNGALTILADVVELKRRPLFTGILIAFAQLGIVAGPLIGGALTEYTTWRWCFWLNLPAGGVVAVLLTIMPVSSSRPKTTTSLGRLVTELDLSGFAIFGPSMVMLLLALQWGGTKYEWSSATIIGFFCGSGVLFLIFLWWEKRQGDNAMIPLRMVKNRIFWTSCVNTLVLMGLIMVASFYVPIYFQSVKGDSPFTSGYHLLPAILSQLLFGVAAGIAVTKLEYYLPWSLSGGILNIVGHALLSTLSPTTAVARWVGYLIVVGSGRGASMQMGIIAVQNHLSQDVMPVALATLIFSQNLGGAVLLCIANALFANRLRSVVSATAPSLDIQRVIAAGGSAAGVQALVDSTPGLELRVLQNAFSEGVSRVFQFAAGVSGAMVLASFGMGVRTKAEGEKKEEEGEKKEEEGEKKEEEGEKKEEARGEEKT